MLGHSGAHHVQIDIDNALMQMIIGFGSCSVIPLLPERAVAVLAPVRPAINCMLSGMTSPPVSFTKRCTWLDDIQRRAALTFVP